MNSAQIEKAYKNGNPNHFKVAADYITKHYVSSPKNGPELNAHDKSVISAITAKDMATGAKLVKGKYLLAGSLMGAALVIALGMIVNEFKKKGEQDS